MFIHTNQPLITSFYIKKVPNFSRVSDESALIRNFLRNGRVRGKPIGRVRLKFRVNQKTNFQKIRADILFIGEEFLTD